MPFLHSYVPTFSAARNQVVLVLGHEGSSAVALAQWPESKLASFNPELKVLSSLFSFDDIWK